MKKTLFKTCPVCGCALDPGERCDCTDDGGAASSEETAPETAHLTPPERAYYGRAVVGVDLAKGRDFTAEARL